MSRLPGLRSLRGRLVSLLLLGAVPLAAMAAMVAWQDYSAAVTRMERNTLLLEQSASTRHRAAIEEVERTLAAIAAAPDVRTDRPMCERLLNDALLLGGHRFIALAVLDAGGQPLCAAAGSERARTDILSGSGREWFRVARDTEGFAVLAERAPGPARAILIDAAYPMLDGTRVLGVAAATVRVDWFDDLSPVGAAAYNVWLVDPDGALIPTPASSPAALPPFADLHALLASTAGLMTTRATSRRTHTYAVADLGGGLRVLVARDASQGVAAARQILFERIMELGLLLLLGLAAVALGAKLALIEPLQRITRAVARWRGGGRFEPGTFAALPSELQGLCNALATATEALAEREGQLRRALEKQELLAQEIHHRVKNNLQVVASLLNLQAARIRQPEARAAFQSARDRVRALATLHRHLYLHGEPQTINMRGFLEELCGQLLQALGPAEGGRIRLDIQAADLGIAGDRAVPLALIVTETVGNAVKYAFPAGRGGKISVELTAEGDRLRLVIQDDGVGLPAGGSETETGVRDGIGRHLVRGLARQLGATLTVSEAAGTRYELVMPLAADASDAAAPEGTPAALLGLAQ